MQICNNGLQKLYNESVLQKMPHPYQNICTKTIQNIYKIIQNTKFLYILYTKIVQIKILYDNVQEMYIKFLHIYKKMYKL